MAGSPARSPHTDASRPRARLEWSPIAEAAGYRVRVASDPGFKSIVLAEASLKPEWEGELPASGTLYWSVQATVGPPSEPERSEDSAAARPQSFKPHRIGLAAQILAQHVADQRPESVATMGIIFALPDRCIARQAAQDQQARVGVDAGRDGEF